MYYCSNCGKPLDPDAKFCANCGAAVPVSSASAAYAEPVAAAPVTAPVVVDPVPRVYAAPVCSTKTKVLGFVGMGLAIGGLFMAVLGIIYTLLGLSTGEEAMGFAFAFAFSIFSLPLSIVGGVLCGRSSYMGNRSAACSIGSKMRVAGIIVSAVMLFLGFISLFL